jgi:hypothetical protein
MKNNIIKYMACAAMALGLAATVQAATITGGISLAGGPLVVNTGDLATGTAVTGFGSVGVTSVSGSYASIVVAPGAGTPYVYTQGFTFLPSPGLPTGPVNIWAFYGNNGITVYDFWLSTVQTVSQGILPNGTHFLDVSGMGTLDIGGDSVLGSYTLTANSASSTFSFSSSNGAQVPDGGMTVMLLGAALSGLALIRRKLA